MLSDDARLPVCPVIPRDTRSLIQENLSPPSRVHVQKEILAFSSVRRLLLRALPLLPVAAPSGRPRLAKSSSLTNISFRVFESDILFFRVAASRVRVELVFISMPKVSTLARCLREKLLSPDRNLVTSRPFRVRARTARRDWRAGGAGVWTDKVS